MRAFPEMATWIERNGFPSLMNPTDVGHADLRTDMIYFL